MFWFFVEAALKNGIPKLKNMSTRKSVAFIAALIFLVFGNAFSASAATVTNITSTTSAALVYNTSNASSISVTFALPTARPAGVQNVSANGFTLTLSNIASTNLPANGQCGGVTYSGNQPGSSSLAAPTFFDCYIYRDGSNPVIELDSNSAFDAGATITITFPSGTFTTASSGNIGLSVVIGEYNGFNITPFDTGTGQILVGAAGSTVTFNSNGGSGSMSGQTASTSTALLSNTFTKAGYTFGGWASSQSNANAGSVAYANGANYAFSSSTTLYAIWNANSSGSSNGNSDAGSSLPTTGLNPLPYLFSGFALIALGMGLIIARRKKTN